MCGDGSAAASFASPLLESENSFSSNLDEIIFHLISSSFSSDTNVNFYFNKDLL